MIKGSILQEHTILNVYAPNNSVKLHEEKLIELQEETDGWRLNIPLSEMVRSSRQKIKKLRKQSI